MEAPKSEARKTEVSSYTNVGVKRKTVTFGRTKIKVKRRNKIQNRLDKRYWALKENRNIPVAKIMSYHVFVRSYLAKGKQTTAVPLAQSVERDAKETREKKWPREILGA